MGFADKVSPTVKLAVIGLTIPALIFYTLALVGSVSVSPGIPAIYLFLLQVDKITLRVGYFAMCAVDGANSARIPVSKNGTASNATSADGTTCVGTFGLNATELSGQLFGSNDDVVPILDLALTLQRQILVPLVLVAAFLMLFGAIFYGLAKVTQMKLKNPDAYASVMKQLSIFKPATLSMVWLSVIVAFAAAVASTMAVGALNFIIPVLATNINVTGGKILQTFQYLAFIFGALFAVGASLMIGDPLEKQQGMMGGDEYPPNEKNLDGSDYDESMMPPEGQEGVEGMEGQPGQYPEGEYPQEGQYPEGAEPGAEYDQQQYAETQEYAQQEQQYAEGGEYSQEEYAQQQQQMQQQQQHQQYQQQ